MADIYVATNGDNGNAGTRAAPLLTLNYAFNTAAADGDRIILMTPNGEWFEDWGSGYPNFNRSGVTVDICSEDPSRPAKIGGTSSTFGVRATNGTVRFYDIDFVSSASGTTSVFGSSTSNTLTGWQFFNCRFIVRNDVASTCYCVQQSSTGDWTNWEFHDCEFLARGSVANGVLFKQGSMGVYRSKIRCTRGSSTIGIRLQDGVDTCYIVGCEITAASGISQNAATQAVDLFLIDNDIIGSTYGVVLSGTSSGTVTVVDDNNRVFATGGGWVAAGNNIEVSMTDIRSRAQNPALGIPTDGGYSSVTGTVLGGTAVAWGASSHCLLAGVGSADTYYDGLRANAGQSVYGVVAKDTGRLMRSTILGGSSFSVYMKGATGWEISNNWIYQNNGGAVWGTAIEGATQTSGNNIERNTVFLDSGSLFSHSASGDDGTSTYDHNGYVLTSTATWGAIAGVTVSSLANVRTQLGGSNELYSRESYNDPKEGGVILELQGDAGTTLASVESTLVADVLQVQTSVNTIDGIVDLILVDTGTTIPAQITALNNISSADVLAQATAALGTYDPPTKAELDAGLAALNDPSATAIAAAVWGETQSGYVTVGTFGYYLDSLVSAAGGGGLTAEAIADAVWDENLTTHLTANSTGLALSNAGSAGDPWGTNIPGAYAAGTAGYILGNNVDAPISSAVSALNGVNQIYKPLRPGVISIVPGDDYQSLARISELSWDLGKLVTANISTAVLRVFHRTAGTELMAASGFNASDDGSTTTLDMRPTKTETELLANYAGEKHRYEVVITYDDGRVETKYGECLIPIIYSRD